jgi:hypothetical protein
MGAISNPSGTRCRRSPSEVSLRRWPLYQRVTEDIDFAVVVPVVVLAAVLLHRDEPPLVGC